MTTSEIIHTGQYHPYGDSYTVYRITTDELKTEDEVKEWAMENGILGKKTPNYKEYCRNTAYDSDMWKSVNYYQYVFAGYYTIQRVNNDFELKFCYPWAD